MLRKCWNWNDDAGSADVGVLRLRFLAEAAGHNETEGAVERVDWRQWETGEQEAGDCSEATARVGELKTD